MNALEKLAAFMRQHTNNPQNHPVQRLMADLAFFDGSSCCPLCSLYKGRIFSVSGKDKRFPAINTLPLELHDGRCDVCGCYYGFCSYFEGVSSPDIVTAIQKSNAPLKDRRTKEQKEYFEEKKAKMARKIKRS